MERNSATTMVKFKKFFILLNWSKLDILLYKGVFLREIYGDFLSPKYDEKQVMIKSTHYLRIIKTAQLIVSSLYKPKNATNWNEQSAPLPTPNATLQQLWSIPNCARYDQLLSQVLKSEEFNKSVDYYKVFKILWKYEIINFINFNSIK